MDTRSHILHVYEKTGSTLTSPQIISGMLNLAAIFTQRAATFPDRHYKRKVFGCLLFYVMICTADLMVCTWPELKSNVAIFAPLAVLLIGVIYLRLPVLCKRTSQLRSELEALESYLDLCEISDTDFHQLLPQEDQGVCGYRLVGSAADGFGFYASQGSNKQPFQQAAVITQDIDINIFIKTVQIRHHHLRRVPGAEGFTWIVFQQSEAQAIKDPVIKESLCPAWDDEYILSGLKTTKEAKSQFGLKVKEKDSYMVINHPALTLKTLTNGQNGVQQYEIDLVFAFRYPQWPEEANEWITRERSGVDSVTVQNIAGRGCYLVHKHCGDGDFAHDHQFDWRFTFAAAEADLFHYHRDKKALKLAFVILKFLIKINTKPMGAFEKMMVKCAPNMWSNMYEAFSNRRLLPLGCSFPVLRTYHLKTTFLWMTDEGTDLDYYTIRGNKDLDKVFMTLLNRYLQCVKDRSLPNYFIRLARKFKTPQPIN